MGTNRKNVYFVDIFHFMLAFQDSAKHIFLFNFDKYEYI